MTALPLLALVLLLGAFGVLQAAFNRQVSAAIGLAPAVLLNTLVFLAMASAFFAAWRLAGRGASAGTALAESVRWWWLFPGILGFCVVAGLPFAIQRIGAARVFVALVAAQMITGLAWDAVVEKLPVSGSRIAGVILVAIGVVVTFRK